jgi:hypothetical protein
MCTCKNEVKYTTMKCVFVIDKVQFGFMTENKKRFI